MVDTEVVIKPARLESGGYSIDLFVAKGQVMSMICPICTEVVRSAVSTPCHHLFCSSCIRQVVNPHGTGRCPCCRKRIQPADLYANGVIDKMVKEQPVWCENKADGCDWTGALMDSVSHLARCEYAKTKCPQCKRPVLKVEVKQHMIDTCEMRRVPCGGCGEEMAFKAIEHHQRWDCPEQPVECPNECKVKGLLRKMLKAHTEKQCPLQVVECPFSDAGCHASFSREELGRHLAENTQFHLDRTHEELKRVRKESQQAISSMQTLCQSLQNLLIGDMDKAKREQALLRASEDGCLELVRGLLETKVDMEARDSNKRTPLLLAADNGKRDVAALLVKCGSDIHATDSTEWTALHYAAREGAVEITEILIEAGVNINARKWDQWSAVHLAAYNGHEVIVSLLLKANADVNAVTNGGQTALELAREEEYESIVRILSVHSGQP